VTRNHTLDVARLVAIFGVIAIHCAPTTVAAGCVTDFALNFCVPFFLLSSLYLFWRECDLPGASAVALRRRLPRLLLPYLSWSAIYLLARIVKLALRGDGPGALLSGTNLVSVIFAGGAAVHLYFLPLLALGLVLSHLLASKLPAAPGSRRTVLVPVLVAGAVLSVVSAHLEAALPIRLVVLYADWAMWLVGPISAAALLASFPADRPPRPALGAGLLVGAIVLDILIVARALPYAWRLHGLLLAVLLLVACEQLRHVPPRSVFWQNFVRTTFGIFLVHHLVLEAIEFAAARFGFLSRLVPYSLASLVLVGSATFVISATMTWAIGRNRRLSGVLLAG